MSRNNKLLATILISACVLLGGFYDSNVAVLGVIVSAALVYFMLVEKSLMHFVIVPRSVNDAVWLCPYVIFLLSVLTCFFATDKMTNLFGIMRLGICLLWFYLYMQISYCEKVSVLVSIPFVGAVGTVLGIVSLITPFSAYFWQAGRLGGFVQYPNTWALVCGIGIMVMLSEKEMKTAFRIGMIIMLLSGMLLSGCRSILILFILWTGIRIIKNKGSRKSAIIILLGVIVSAAMAYLCGGGDGLTQNIGRLFTIGKYNSTLIGRILYNLDACKYLIKHPFGLGFMGYYYRQGSFASGVYTTRFVHNDFLQVGLDYGILSGILFTVFIIFQIVKGKQSMLQKEILLFVSVASLFDFHMQYMAVVFIMVACMDVPPALSKCKKGTVNENIIFASIIAIVCVYIAIPTTYTQIGKYDSALYFLPGYTEAMVMRLATIDDVNEANRLSEEIIAKNKYCVSAHNALVYTKAMHGQIPEMIDEIECAISLDPYNVTRYVAYSELIDATLAQGTDEIELLLKEKEDLAQTLKSMEGRTSALAYYIKDKPVFEY